jgi:hypothetical protein
MNQGDQTFVAFIIGMLLGAVLALIVVLFSGVTDIAVAHDDGKRACEGALPRGQVCRMEFHPVVLRATQ